MLDHLDFIFDLLLDITITLTFLHSMSDHDAVQLAANRLTDPVHDVSATSGPQTIDTDAPLVLHSSLSLILSLFFSHSDVNL